LIPAHIIIYFYELLASLFSKLPFSRAIVGKHSFILLVIYYVVLVLIANLASIVDYYRFKIKNVMPQTNPRRLLKERKSKLVVTLALLIVAAGIWLIPEKQGFEVDIIDVGQGDGIYISSGDGVRFFIDGGSTSSDAVGKYTLLPFLKYKGAGHIDYWFLSHMDLDHVSGVLELLDMGYRIDNIVLSAEIPEGETLMELLALADANNTNVLYMKQGDVCGTKHLSFSCVYPFEGMISDDINALSLSLAMKYDENCDGVVDYSGFFGGDIGAEQEQAIAASGLVGHVDLLKVSHHGSKFSSDPEFLSILSPDVAVISCAKVNRYGHPSAEAIERISVAAGQIYYTMNSGRVRARVGEVNGYIGEE
ncbi:MAG: MBL fold metallo-hydrolase, partial [Pseudobutyrivibrio sp.]|nr:MBL fold metallo-hydrolase [Pseudobutyrivibrio sp.]